MKQRPEKVSAFLFFPKFNLHFTMPHPFSGLFEKYIRRHNITDRIGDGGAGDVGITVVIPAYLEKDYISACLDSLVRTKEVSTGIEVIVMVNAPEDAAPEILSEQEETFLKIKEEFPVERHSRIRIIPVKEFDIAKKHFGAGHARKTGMDQAVLRYFTADNPNGVIVSLDADCVVAPDYFEEIEKYFSVDRNKGCSIYFEHPLKGEMDARVYDAVTQYELHLRYYKTALGRTGFPYAFHTVGSAFAVRASAYVKAGGMPRKQAGEDFYLIQKVVQTGGYGELNTTCVYPSARPSTRVPFGTGPAVKKLIGDDAAYKTFNLQAFSDLKKLFDRSSSLFGISKNEFDAFLKKMPESISDFLTRDDFYDSLEHLNNNCSSQKVFNKRFFEMFNAFKVVKYLNFVHERYYQKIPVTDAALFLLNETVVKPPKPDAKTLLKTYRELEK